MEKINYVILEDVIVPFFSEILEDYYPQSAEVMGCNVSE